MADAVTTKVIANTASRYVVHLTNVSDGTGEAAVIKVDKSTLLATDGAEPGSLDIERVFGNTVGMIVTLLWDHTADETALVLNGNFDFNFTLPGATPELLGLGGLADGRGAGGTGDILLTTTGATAGDTYDITLVLFKNPN